MYKDFFGLTDNPFSIIPNLNYFFLNEKFNDALLCLEHGLTNLDGIVLLTGGVGTGKTTLSRLIQQKLPKNIEPLVIYNPTLSEIELLQVIADKLGAVYDDKANKKQLLDLLNQQLVAKYQQGRRVLLLIDEAQHLTLDVLEQLRLISHLQQDNQKLLQIFLIGHSELEFLIDSPDLTAFSQRITARYQLPALTNADVASYVQYRVSVAGGTDLFSAKALSYIAKLSGGIPRIINLICDRALLLAFATEKKHIKHNIILQAADGVKGISSSSSSSDWLYPTLMSFLLGFIIVFMLLQTNLSNSLKAIDLFPSRLSLIDNGGGLPDTNPVKQGFSGIKSAVQHQLVKALANSHQINDAFSTLLGLWQSVPYKNMSPCQAAQQQGLECYQQTGDLDKILTLNYPAVVYLKSKHHKYVYGVVIAYTDGKLLLQLGEQRFWVNKVWFNQYFANVFEIFWRPQKKLHKSIGPANSSQQLHWIADALTKFDHIPANKLQKFDDHLANRIKAFQKQHNLVIDGIAGNQTLKWLSLYTDHTGPKLTNIGNKK